VSDYTYHPFETRCSCRELIVWFYKNGKRIAVNANSTKPSEAAHKLGPHHVEHTYTCPNRRR
jgi:hypothetical protein